jgi:hypothetical protein
MPEGKPKPAPKHSPPPESVTSRIPFVSPKGGKYTIVRTNLKDATDRKKT